jgi:hypothetical protein
MNTLFDHIRVNLIGHRGRRRPVTTTKRKHVYLHKTSFTTGFQSLLEFRVCFPWEAHDHIGAEGGIVSQHIPDLIQTFQKTLDSITPSHASQHAVASALQRRMKLRTQMLTITSSLDEIIVDFDRFNTGKTHSPVAGDTIQTTQQVPQSLRLFSRSQVIRIDTKVSHMNTADHDLTVSMLNQRADFFFDVDGTSTSQTRSNRRNNAVRTLQNAAILNFHERSLMSFEFTDPVGHINNAEATQHIREFAFVGHNFNHIGQLGNRSWIPRGITAHHDRFCARILPRQLPDHLTGFRVTSIRHCACIDDAQIRRLTFHRFTIATLQQRFTDKLSFVLVDFAAQSYQAAGSKI